jgi:hypothetical protein
MIGSSSTRRMVLDFMDGTISLMDTIRIDVRGQWQPLAEQFGEMDVQPVDYLLNSGSRIALFGHGGDRGVEITAGIDPVESCKVRMDIETAAMHTDPAADPDANEADLAACRPYSWLTRTAIAANTEVAYQGKQEFLKKANPEVEIAATPPQINQGIADYLPGAMPSNITATVNAFDWEGWVENIGQIATTTDGVHRRVLQQEHGFRVFAGEDGSR